MRDSRIAIARGVEKAVLPYKLPILVDKPHGKLVPS